MRPLAIAVLCWAGLSAAETIPRCTGDTVGHVSLPDLVRTQERWQAGPLAQLCRRPWAQALFDRLDPWWSDLGIEPAQILEAWQSTGAIQAVAERRAGSDGLPRVQIDLRLRPDHSAEAMAAIADRAMPLPTRLGPGGHQVWLAGSWDGLLHDDRFTLRYAPLPSPVVVQSPLPISADLPADVALALRPALVDIVSTLTDDDSPPETGYEHQTVAITCTPYGLHERSEQLLTPDHAQALAGLRLPVIDRTRFDDLPATTLWAVVARSERTTTRELLDRFLPAGDPDLMSLDAQLQQLHLGDLRSLLLAIDGDVVIFVEAGSPFPVISASIAMDGDAARALLERLDQQLSLDVDDAGMHSGLVGLVPFAVTFRDGQLELTTDPLGLAGVAARRGGFTTHPDVQTAIAQLLPDAMVAGVSRSGPSWETCGRLALLALMELDLPQMSTMPRDLGQAGKMGFVSYAIRDDRILCDAGGLFGGPICWVIALVGGSLLAIDAMQSEAMPPVKAAPVPVAPVEEAQ